MSKKTQQQASFLQRFWLPIILALITLLGIIVTAIGPSIFSSKTPTITNSPSNSFDYQVRVETITGDPIANATVTLEIGGGKVPLDSLSDSTGLARIFIEASYSSQPGRLIVEASGYSKYTKNIDLTEGDLPKVIQLDSAP